MAAFERNERYFNYEETKTEISTYEVVEVTEAIKEELLYMETAGSG